jgi:hypothetical protein
VRPLPAGSGGAQGHVDAGVGEGGEVSDYGPSDSMIEDANSFLRLQHTVEQAQVQASGGDLKMITLPWDAWVRILDAAGLIREWPRA